MLLHTAGFEPANIELDRLKEQEFFWHTLWNILVHRCEGFDSNTGLKVPCKHILPFYSPFFTEKKLRTLI